MMSGYSVYIVEDDQQITSSLHWLFDSVNYKVSSYNNLEDFLKINYLNHPCCLLIDIQILEAKELELQDIFLSSGYMPPVIVMSELNDITIALRAMKSGAYNFFLKPINAQLLLDNTKEAVIYDEISFKEQQIRKNAQARFEKLTNREYEILLLLINNLTSKIIARLINISPNTVDLHRAKIIKKLRAKSIIDVVNLAWCAGIIDTKSFSEDEQSEHISY